MGKKNKKLEYENIKVPKAYVDKLRANKESTGVSIIAFTCQAIDEKLNHHKGIENKLSEFERHFIRRKYDPDYGVKIKKPKGV